MGHRLTILTAVAGIFLSVSLWGQQSLSPTPDSSAQANPQAAVPRLIRFSGSLQDLSGKPITGPADVTFSLYSVQSGGSALWFETQTVQADSLGNYKVLLGAMTPAGVPMELFTQGETRWLGVQVANLPEQPRVLLVSVPYAMKAGDAETLGGKPASAFMLAPQAACSVDVSSPTAGERSSPLQPGCATTSNGTTGTTQSKSVTGKTGGQTPKAVTITSSYIPMFADGAGTLTNSVMYQYGTRIGVGTTTPSFPFDLNGNVFAIGPKAALPGAGGTMRFRDDTATVRWSLGLPGSAGATDFFLYNNASGHAPVYVQAGAASYSLYLNANGNVGIGTMSPTQKLDVAGNVHASGGVTAASFTGDGSGLTNVGSSTTVITASTGTFSGDIQAGPGMTKTPLAYGNFASDATKNVGSSNISCTWNADQQGGGGYYKCAVTGESLDSSHYIYSVTPSIGPTIFTIPELGSNPGDPTVIITFYNLSVQTVQPTYGFSLVIYKP